MNSLERLQLLYINVQIKMATDDRKTKMSQCKFYKVRIFSTDSQIEEQSTAVIQVSPEAVNQLVSEAVT